MSRWPLLSFRFSFLLQTMSFFNMSSEKLEKRSRSWGQIVRTPCIFLHCVTGHSLITCWQDFGLFWPPTYPGLTFVKEFLYCCKRKSAYCWHFQYHLPTLSCQGRRLSWCATTFATLTVAFSSETLRLTAKTLGVAT